MFRLFRAGFVLLSLAACFAALTFRVAYLQTVGRQQTMDRAERQLHRKEPLLARRGSIYDANGMLMAGTVQTRDLFVDPRFMQSYFSAEGRSLVQMDEAIAKLARLIDMDSFELARIISERFESRFVRLAENLDEGTCNAIRALNIPGVGLVPENQRYYPMGSIAAHVLGGTRKDGVGLEGVEFRYDRELSGRHGFKRTMNDAYHRPISATAEDYVPPQHGQHLILTIDANIQMIAEQELAAACERVRAKRGEVVVMDPRTGDILAMANWPAFNPQNLSDSPQDVRRNRCLTDPFEPGSVMKVFVAGSALSWRVTRPDEVWPIPAITWTTSYGRRVTDVWHYGPLSTWDVLIKSSNIGMSMLGNRMGNERLHRSVQSYGFGRRTGIDLPGEDPGRVIPLQRWTRYSTESISQGYELMVTPLQITRAFCAFANGGRLVQPRIVKGILDANGNVISRDEPTSLQMLPEAVDPVTAAAMKRILADTMVRGTGRSAKARTWNIFGKTGTSHISEGAAGYSQSRYTSSFLAGAPAESPRLVVYLVVHEPDKDYAVSQGMSYYGGAVAAPNACRLLERALAYLQVPASPPLPPPPPEVAKVLWNYNPNDYRTSSAR